MPDTRPGITFMEDRVCAPCHNYEKQKTVDWNSRLEEDATANPTTARLPYRVEKIPIFRSTS